MKNYYRKLKYNIKFGYSKNLVVIASGCYRKSWVYIVILGGTHVMAKTFMYNNCPLSKGML